MVVVETIVERQVEQAAPQLRAIFEDVEDFASLDEAADIEERVEKGPEVLDLVVVDPMQIEAVENVSFGRSRESARNAQISAAKRGTDGRSTRADVL